VNNSHPSYWLDIFDRFFLNSHHLIPNAQSLLEKIKNGAILKTDFDFMEKLCSYYRQVEAEKLPKIFEEFEENMHNNPNFKSNHILKMNYLSKLNQLCLKYSNLGKEYLHINEIFKHKAENLKKEMSSYSIDDYKFIKISASSKIEKEKLERYVQWFFEKQYSNEKENLRSIFFKIVANFLIDKEKDKLEFESLQSKNSFQALCNRILVDEQGTITAASPLYDDKLIKYCADNLFYVAPILESVLEKFKQEFTINFICENMILSPVFDKEEDGNFLLHGLKAFWAGDYLTASLTFSPLIESCFRNFVKISGGNFITENDFNGYEYKTLGALFDDEKINEVFTYFKRDVAFYFRLVLTEKLGWNLRNTIAHGVNKRILFDRRYADRLLHILICLSVLS
jgi:hypothetical protein